MSNSSTIPSQKTYPAEAKNGFFNLLEFDGVGENGQVSIDNMPEGENVAVIAEMEAKNDFSNLLDRVENGQVSIVNRPEGENVVLIAESEFASLIETVYLLRSPANARRLFDALEESKSGNIQPQTIEELKQELEIEQKEEEV